MTPIQQDPARRIRRIQRWLRVCGQMMPGAQWLYPFPQKHERWNTADALFAVELDWLCEFTIAARNAWDRDIGCAEQTIAEQKARIEALREGLLSIQSDPTNASKDAEYYLNRDV